MTTALPEPIAVPWTMKTLESAKTSVDIEDDGRMHLAIEHDVMHGVSPEMLLWWFRNMHGTIEIEGRAYPRYRVWHPLDHVEHRYVRTPANGQAGPGSVFHIHEVFARNPAWEIDVWTDVTRLDEGGFSHRPRVHGLSGLVQMDYTFERVPGGTRYRNSLTVDLGLPRWLGGVGRALRALAFTEAQGRAWLRHNVEEVGNFEHFLPALHASAHGRPIPRTGVQPDVRAR